MKSLLVKLALVAALVVPTTVATTAVAASASPSSGCNPAIASIIRRDFGRAAPWAISIAWRESRCIPTAANRRSSARGVFQMMVPLHARQFAAVGCSWRQWANPYCNIAAAAHLYREQGTRPWR